MRSRGFLLALALLALLHLYMGWRLLPALAGGSAALQITGGLLLSLMFVLVPAGLLSRGVRPVALADRLAWIGFLAMGLFSSLLLLTLLRDLLLGGTALAGHLGDWFRIRSAQAVPLLALAVSAIGFYNARRLARVVEVDVPIAGLPTALAGFSIAQLSDIHVGPTIKRGYLQAIVDRVNGLDADVIAITGDLVDGSVVQLAQHTAPLAGLKSPPWRFFLYRQS